jgi:hypothetical protein
MQVGIEIGSINMTGRVCCDPSSVVWIIIASSKVDKAAFLIIAFARKTPWIAN